MASGMVWMRIGIIHMWDEQGFSRTYEIFYSGFLSCAMEDDFEVHAAVFILFRGFSRVLRRLRRLIETFVRVRTWKAEDRNMVYWGSARWLVLL